jgi:dihydrofolate synthase/folylpolyglutamate synthase
MTAYCSPIRDYQSASDFLFGRINYERTHSVPYRSRGFKLDRMRQLAARLGHPEQAFPAIHIAGTKGKGSTAAMTASVLGAAGYRTGLYTSPHLHRLEERFVVDGQPCDEDTLVSLFSRLEGIVLEMDDEARRQGDHEGPTYFEITTAAALLHFQDRQVDAAVLEVGLGGRLDSTNICRPVTSVITSISFDHTGQLGTTLSAIAREKAGIIKPGIPVVIGVTQPEPYGVIEQVARDNDAELLALGRDFDFDYLRDPPVASGNNHRSQDWRCGLDYREEVRGHREQLSQVAINLLGRHQAANASVAIATCGQLRRQGWRLDESTVRMGLARAHCPARVEILSHAPTVILDTAHNPASIAALMELVLERFRGGPRLLVFATSTDKDAPTMLQQLLPHFEHVVLTRYLNNPRATDPDQLLAVAQSIQQSCGLSRLTLHLRPNPEAAWRLIESLVSPAHLVCITGSFFLAAETRRYAESPGRVAMECS